MPEEQKIQEGLVSAGQRKINLIWECTQALIALAVVMANIAVGVHLGFTSAAGASRESPPMLTNSLFLVIGFYFSRTNHSNTGGVGHKPDQENYTGR